MHVYAWRTCKLPLHSDRCGIRRSFGAVLWLGWETGVSREQLQWYYEQGGRVMKGLHVCMFPLPYGQAPPPEDQRGLYSGSRKFRVGSALIPRSQNALKGPRWPRGHWIRYRKAIGNHSKSIGNHRKSIGDHRTSIGNHRKSIGNHRQ